MEREPRDDRGSHILEYALLMAMIAGIAIASVALYASTGILDRPIPEQTVVTR